MLQGFLYFLISLVSLFLILVILIQRGRGGGLVGAFGGAGGSSAFGTKAGDVFTRITVVVAVIWFLIAIALVRFSTPGLSDPGLDTEAERDVFNFGDPSDIETFDSETDVPQVGQGQDAPGLPQPLGTESSPIDDNSVGPGTLDLPPLGAGDDTSN